MQAIEGKSVAQKGLNVRAKSASKTHRGVRFAALCAVAVLAALFIAGCGGKRGDAGASHATFKVNVVRWTFPRVQPLGKPVNFTLVVENVDSKAIPELVVTVQGLKTFVKQTGAASIIRPVWVPNDTNYADVTPNASALGTTFSLGALAANATHRYVLPLTPIRRGHFPTGYALAGNLSGDAKVTLDDGNPASDSRTIFINPKPVFDESVFK